MKSFSAALLVIYVVFTISGILCAENVTENLCNDVNAQCRSDNDCCSKVCRISFNFKKYCKEMKLLPTLMSKFSLTTSVPASCVYNISTNNKVADEEMFKTIGIHAAADHRLLKPGTIVNVLVGDNIAELKISPRPADNPGTLELSDAAATLLGIKNFGTSDCKVQVPFWENHKVLRRFFILVPVSGIVYALYLFNQLNLY